MYYPKKIREQKVKELENNKEFISYAQKQYDIYKRVSNFNDYNTFEDYLIGDIFCLYENFTMLKLIKKANKKTINRTIDMALVGI